MEGDTYPHPQVAEDALRRQYFGGNADGEASPLANQLRGFLNESASRPYALRERQMNDEALGWEAPEVHAFAAQATPSSAPHPPRSKMGGPLLPPPRSSSRARRRRVWPPLYDAPDITKRYRKIEDLSYYLSTGVINDSTWYFKEPMQRRLSDQQVFVPPQQRIITVGETDPRFAPCWAEEKTRSNFNEIIPKKVQMSKRKFDQTTGLVKPYALGSGHRAGPGKAIDLFSMDNAMDTYVMKMQCQRPTKGLYTPY